MLLVRHYQLCYCEQPPYSDNSQPGLMVAIVALWVLCGCLYWNVSLSTYHFVAVDFLLVIVVFTIETSWVLHSSHLRFYWSLVMTFTWVFTSFNDYIQRKGREYPGVVMIAAAEQTEWAHFAHWTLRFTTFMNVLSIASSLGWGQSWIWKNHETDHCHLPSFRAILAVCNCCTCTAQQ